MPNQYIKNRYDIMRSGFTTVLESRQSNVGLYVRTPGGPRTQSVHVNN